MLLDSQKVQVRRHLGYPVMGLYKISPAGGTLGSAAAGYRFFQSFSFLEYKMNNMMPSEEASLLGYAVGSLALVGPQPNIGDTLSLTITGGGLSSPVTVSTTAPAVSGNPMTDMRLVMCNGIAGQIAQNASLQALGFRGYTPFGTGPFSQNAIPIPEVSIAAPAEFTLAASVNTGSPLAPQIGDTGTFVPPYASLDGVTTIYGFIPILNGLEAAHAGASQDLDTSRADVWFARSDEIAQRTSLYRMWQMRMSDFLGVRINPWQPNQNKLSRAGAVRYV